MRVVTAYALHAQIARAVYLAGAAPAHHLITVKRNQPGLYAQIAGLRWRQIPAAGIEHYRGHGRGERRALKVTAAKRPLAGRVDMTESIYKLDG